MNKTIKFIDLFAGIGGFRLALESVGFECVFSSEINKHAAEMYELNFKENPLSDITKINASDIPDFHILTGGFPCQAFSVAGKQNGFEDTRGTLFFDVCKILEVKKPKVFILENVKNLVVHDEGKTFDVIMSKLKGLGYNVNFEILNALDFKTPQNRERVILVGCKDDTLFDFSKIVKYKRLSMSSYLDKCNSNNYLSESEYTILDSFKRQKSGLIFVGYRNKKLRKVGVRENTEHLSRSHKQPNRIYHVDGTHPTIASQESSGRYFIFDGTGVRKLTLDECFSFMGFPKKFKKIGSKSNLYRCIGNSVCIGMITEVAKQIKSQFFV